MASKAFRRLYFKHGFLTSERRTGINQVFFSFYYEPDSWRVNQIKNMRIHGSGAIGDRGGTETAASSRTGAANSHTRTRSRTFFGGLFSTLSERNERTNQHGDTESRDFRGWRIGVGRSEAAGRWGDRSNIVSANEWKAVSGGGDTAIRNWINDQMQTKECLIVLIGTQTADRPWVIYEIEKAWQDRKGIFGIYVHNLKNSRGEQSLKGDDPFERVFKDGVPSVIRTYDPPYTDSKGVYSHIQGNLNSWVAQAIDARNAK